MADGSFPGLVSRDRNTNAQTNAIWVRLTDDTTAVTLTGTAVDVNISNASVAVTATDLDIRDLLYTQDSVQIWANTAKDGTGTDYIPVVDADGQLQVDVLSLPAITINSDAVDDSAFTIATDYVSVAGFLADETTPDSVDEGDVGAARMTLDRKQLMVIADPTTDANRLGIDASGYITSNINGTVTVDANSSDVTVDNGAGAAAVNIQDGGNSITIDDGGGTITVDGTVTVTATDLDIRDLTHVSDSVSIGDGTTLADVLDGTIDALYTAVTDGTDTWSIDGSGYGQVDIAAQSLTAVKISKDANANTETNPIYVYQVNTVVSGSEIHDYDTASAVASDASDNHDYTVANTTFFLKSVIVAGSGNIKAEIQTGPVASLATKAVVFLTGRQGDTKQVFFDPPIEVPSTSTGTVRIIRTNRQGSATDLYSTIIGNDV